MCQRLAVLDARQRRFRVVLGAAAAGRPLQECERLCDEHKLAFDAADVLEAYLDEIAENNAKEETAPKKKTTRPARQTKRRRMKSSR